MSDTSSPAAFGKAQPAEPELGDARARSLPLDKSSLLAFYHAGPDQLSGPAGSRGDTEVRFGGDRGHIMYSPPAPSAGGVYTRRGDSRHRGAIQKASEEARLGRRRRRVATEEGSK